MMNELITCKGCGEKFARPKPTGQKPKYCTKVCRNKHWNERNPGRRKELNDAHLLARYGLTQKSYNTLLKSQDGVCAICSGPPNGPGKRLHVDHDHETGEVRGLLCGKCNTAIGLLNDSEELLCSAITYLMK